MIETINIRPGKKYAGFAKRLKEVAAKSGRSVNNFVLYELDKIMKETEKKKIKKRLDAL